MAKEILSNGFVTKDEQLTCSDTHQEAITQDTLNDKEVQKSICFFWLALINNWVNSVNMIQNVWCNGYIKISQETFFWSNQRETWKNCVGILIPTVHTHTHEAVDLDKLSEQAQYQRVMIISDTTGMGISTVLTHLSKQIKHKFPVKWMMIIDLNGQTDALNAVKALKKEQISKEKAIEFVSEKVLKYKPGLEVKEGCEQKQKLKFVIMLNGFDESSPSLKRLS